MFVQWIVALISTMEAEELQVHASPFVASLSRFMEDGPTASILKSSLKGNVLVSSELILETRDIADEGLKLIQTKLGTTSYLEIANAVRQEALGRREERKMKRSLEAVTDPEKAAQKKIRQHRKVIIQCRNLLICRGKKAKRKRLKGSKIGALHWRDREVYKITDLEGLHLLILGESPCARRTEAKLQWSVESEQGRYIERIKNYNSSSIQRQYR
jgi:hypothetical protein